MDVPLQVLIQAPEGEIILGQKLRRGELPPGLSLERDNRGLVLTGVPEELGAWRAELAVETDGEGFRLTLEILIRAAEPTAAPVPEVTPEPTPAPTRAPTPVPEPEIVKDPTDETVEEGGAVMFIARADNVSGRVWELLDPEGNTVCRVQDASERFPGLWAEGQGTEVLTMGPITRELDGWQVVCLFVGYDDTTVPGAPARIHVSGGEEEPTPESREHVHDFGSAWHWNDAAHWRECACGAQEDGAPHSMTWTEERPATARQDGEMTGVCSVCGYTLRRGIPATGEGDRSLTLRWILGGVLLAVAALLALGLLWLGRRIRWEENPREEGRGYQGRYDGDRSRRR